MNTTETNNILIYPMHAHISNKEKIIILGIWELTKKWKEKSLREDWENLSVIDKWTQLNTITFVWQLIYWCSNSITC